MYQPAFIYCPYRIQSFCAYPTLDARGVFLDMSKAFDKVKHEGLIHKLKLMGVSDSLLNLIQSFLTDFKEHYSMVRLENGCL